ncbi:MAG: LAGLIDADG family homing endonuclease [Nanoarchaeota archaeon]
MRFEKEFDINFKQKQLRFNPDGTVSLPENIKKDLSSRKERKEKKLDIWPSDEQDDEIHNLGDNVKGFNLYGNGEKLKPLVFSNNKSQGDIVDEVVSHINNGQKVIFIKGVCGTGKCLDKDTIIFCKLEEEKYFGYYKISELVDKKGEIISLDNFGNLVNSNFYNVRSTGNKKLFKLVTRSGREIIASENHPFLTITKNGLEWFPLKKLTNKSYICLPNQLNINETKDLITEAELKILGHLISEGKLGDKAGSPKYYQDRIINPKIRQDYIDSLKEVFPDGEIRDNHQAEVTIVFRNMDTRFGTTNKLRLFIRKYGLDGTNSKNKFIPKIIFNLQKEKIAVFLKALYSGDGSIYQRKSDSKIQTIIEYGTTSKRLSQDISILLTRFGVQHTITKHSFKGNKEYSWRITISNQLQIKKFIEEIGFLGEKNEITLKIVKNLKEHKFTNIDKVPRIIRDYLKNKGYSFNSLNLLINYDEINKLSERKGYKELIKDKSIKFQHVFRQSKIDFLRSHLNKVNLQIKDYQLNFICNENIYWDKIKSIDFLKEDITYDLEVLNYHNFIANGIIVHNSAIALNIAKKLGRASIVVPGKSLQKQYMEDYSREKYVLKDDHKKLKIKVITGRENHKCLFFSGNANNSDLPCKIEIKESNYGKIKEYLKENPKVKNDLELKNVRRISIAPVCPYWSPVVPGDIELNLKADKKTYDSVRGKYTIYNRKPGCTYYEQFNSYLTNEVIVFNSAKYKIEMAMNRKPKTEVDIIDEADEFLDSFSNSRRINLNRLLGSLNNIFSEDEHNEFIIKKITEITLQLVKNTDFSDKIFSLKETLIYPLFRYLIENPNVVDGVDDENYLSSVYESALDFEDFFDETYVLFRKEERGLVVEIITTNLAKKFSELLDKVESLVLMSGTIHSVEVLKNVFGVDNFAVVDAETVNQGEVRLFKTGKEVDCKYENFSQGKVTRENYLKIFEEIIEKAPRPTLIHVNAFDDLPSEIEKEIFGLKFLITREKFAHFQDDEIEKFKNKEIDVLFTTKCARGVDFPDDQCRSIVFTKYPNPNARDIFWKILAKTHQAYYWDFYKDKAKREFLQKIYRGVRNKEDYVYVLSPDLRVLEAVENNFVKT